MGSTLDTEVGRWMLDTIRSRILWDMTEKVLINSIDRVGRSVSLLFIPIYSALSDIWVVITGNTQLFYSDTINLLLDSTLIPCMLNIKIKLPLHFDTILTMEKSCKERGEREWGSKGLIA